MLLGPILSSLMFWVSISNNFSICLDETVIFWIFYYHAHLDDFFYYEASKYQRSELKEKFMLYLSIFVESKFDFFSLFFWHNFLHNFCHYHDIIIEIISSWFLTHHCDMICEKILTILTKFWQNSLLKFYIILTHILVKKRKLWDWRINVNPKKKIIFFPKIWDIKEFRFCQYFKSWE